MIDWSDSTRIDRIEFEMIDPNDIESSRGWLDGVQREGSSITYAYNTDTRVSGTLRIIDSNYIENSLIRIHHYVDEYNYHAELGTFFVNDADLSYEHGAWSGSIELASRLVILSDDYWVKHYSISAGKTAKSVLAAIFNEEGATYSIAASCRDTKYTAAVVYEFGENVITTVFEVCGKMGAWLDVNSHGVITVNPYVLPGSRTPTWEIDSTMVSGSVSKTTNVDDMPGRVGVVHSMTNDQEITAYADVSTSSSAARSRRGRRITEIVSLSDMSPETNARASAEAKARLSDATALETEYEFDALYQPYRPGDVGYFDLAGGRIVCMIKTLDVSLSPGMKTRVTLKEVS